MLKFTTWVQIHYSSEFSSLESRAPPPCLHGGLYLWPLHAISGLCSSTDTHANDFASGAMQIVAIQLVKDPEDGRRPKHTSKHLNLKPGVRASRGHLIQMTAISVMQGPIQDRCANWSWTGFVNLLKDPLSYF